MHGDTHEASEACAAMTALRDCSHADSSPQRATDGACTSVTTITANVQQVSQLEGSQGLQQPHSEATNAAGDQQSSQMDDSQSLQRPHELIGRDLFITAAMLNHSCEPNCLIVREAGHAKIVTQCPIEVGAKLELLLKGPADSFCTLSDGSAHGQRALKQARYCIRRHLAIIS